MTAGKNHFSPAVLARRVNMKKEKPMTVTEFYNRIWDILKKKGFVPDILDYSLAEKEPVQNTTYRFNIKVE